MGRVAFRALDQFQCLVTGIVGRYVRGDHLMTLYTQIIRFLRQECPRPSSVRFVARRALAVGERFVKRKAGRTRPLNPIVALVAQILVMEFASQSTRIPKKSDFIVRIT